MSIPGMLSYGGSTQGSSMRSATLIWRRRAQGLSTPENARKGSSNNSSAIKSSSTNGRGRRPIRSSTLRLRSSSNCRSAVSAWPTCRRTCEYCRRNGLARAGRTPATMISGQPIRVGQGLERLYALSQLVENGHPALEQGLAIRRQFDALGAAIKQAHAQVVFEVGDRLGDDRMRDGEAL